MPEIDEYRQDLISAGSRALDDAFRATLFVERVCEQLAAGEIVDGLVPCQWQGTHARRKVGVSAGAFHPEDGSLTLLLVHFDGSPVTPSVTMMEVARLCRMLSGFLTAAIDGHFEGKLDDSGPVEELVQTICAQRQVLARVRFLIATDAKASDRVRELSPETHADLPCEFHLWDIGRLNELAGRGHEPLEIDLTSEFQAALPCLPAHMQTDDYYQSYLCVVPGDLLAGLYGRYGARLLETNVRGFLSDRGQINRGLRATLQNRPHMFFAYNNGLTATASAVRVKKGDDGEEIVHIRDLQIVNGGQTTASLYWAKRKHKASLERVFVQLKLTVIPSTMAADDFDQVVSDISRYANSQNKVSEADLFANNPFHREMEKISRRCGLPALDGGQHQTYWFYERARAQYANERAATLTPAAQRQFDKRFPKDQVTTKTDLAKFVNVLDQLPHVVSAGAQKSFKKFAEVAAPRWDKNRDQFNEVFFKRCVGVAMLYRELEKRVQKAPWYSAHRAAIVPYTLSLFSYMVEREGKRLNLLSLWTSQRVSEALATSLTEMAQEVWSGLSNHMDRRIKPQWGNLGEWFKVEQCWTACKNLGIKLRPGLDSMIITEAQYSGQDRTGVRSQQVSAEADARIETIRLLETGYWQRLKDWNQEDPVLSEAEFESVCRLLSLADPRNPKDAECRVLMLAKQRAEANGFMDPTRELGLAKP